MTPLFTAVARQISCLRERRELVSLSHVRLGNAEECRARMRGGQSKVVANHGGQLTEVACPVQREVNNIKRAGPELRP